MHTVNAQDNRKVAIGFKLSPNFAWTRMMEGPMENNGLGLGFSYGLMGDINIANNPNYWLSTEVLITSSPSKISANDTLWAGPRAGGNYFRNVSFNYNLQYLQIPIALKLKTNEIGNFKYWIQTGIAPAVLMQQKLKTTADQNIYGNGVQSHNPNLEGNNKYDFYGDEGNPGQGEFDGKGAFQDNVRKTRISLILGLGIETKISGKTMLSAGLRFDNAFSDVFVDDAVDGRNNFLGIHMGVLF
jgi:hypothetical protein